ncbi:hypothetical protein MLP_46820 [Microlunatus phosphovorus NM-1]|uniref:Uncharacterized protein n=1 Tax=Microlunatus phosphovorus (strain ATCC 700054 / DSM 10555 / JCM 9379 / NBRC 101784 / NCIMB 13414 / VKM Ac-1990 / NM-1) TaxID=1032480 RepID=F5XEE8_MICPN|nr:hypothetical protein MLP_46820 [Microlunatus phosphovorus NM-1]
MAPRRKTYAAHTRSTSVHGPAAQNVRHARATGDRRWPGGAKRLSIPSEPRTSLTRRRQPDRRPQVTPPQSPLRTNCPLRTPYTWGAVHPAGAKWE